MLRAQEIRKPTYYSPHTTILRTMYDKIFEVICFTSIFTILLGQKCSSSLFLDFFVLNTNMKTFQEYMILMEQPGIAGPGALPGGPGGMGGPPGGGFGMPPGGLGGAPSVPPLGGGGLGGPGGPGPLNADPMATPQGPTSNKKPMELKPLDVWGVLEQLLGGKKKPEHKSEDHEPQKEVKNPLQHLET